MCGLCYRVTKIKYFVAHRTNTLYLRAQGFRNLTLEYGITRGFTIETLKKKKAGIVGRERAHTRASRRAANYELNALRRGGDRTPQQRRNDGAGGEGERRAEKRRRVKDAGVTLLFFLRPRFFEIPGTRLIFFFFFNGRSENGCFRPDRRSNEESSSRIGNFVLSSIK